ncbi:hypothetical protein PUND_a1630 [Pseudoalteromonas undina]|nr:hypothetical protein PUND_a1630 [Pseudoalteromonas undina]
MMFENIKNYRLPDYFLENKKGLINISPFHYLNILETDV